MDISAMLKLDTRQARPVRMLRNLVGMAAVLMCQATWAQTATFTGAGTVEPIPGTEGPAQLGLLARGSYEFAGFGTWSLVSAFLFNLDTGIGAGGFEFTNGTDSFSGPLTTTYAPIALGPGFVLSYTVTAGAGSLAGFTGAGSSVVRITSDLSAPPPFNYLEAGIMTVVPEPATSLLLLGGVAALFGRRMLKPT